MRRPGAKAGERGSATLEFVAMFPLLFMVALCALQVGIVGWATTSTTDAARAAARAASLGQDPNTAAQTSLPGGLHAQSVSGGRHGNGYTYTVTVKIPDLLPYLDTGTVSRTISMPGIT